MTTAAPPAPLFGPEYHQNPYPVFRWLQEHSPLHEFRFPVGDLPMWLITRYADVRALLADPRLSTESRRWANADFRAIGLNAGAGSLLEEGIAVLDPPEHTRLRRMAMSAFTPRRIETWRTTVTRVVEQTLDALADRDSAEVLDDYAGQVSSTVLAEILGVRLDRHAELVEHISRAFPTDPAQQAGVPAAFVAVCDYAAELVAEKRGHPGEDLTSALITGTTGGDRLSPDEVVAMIAAIILGGSDTIRAFLGSAVLALLDHPDQLRLWLHNPEIGPAAVEELVRYEGPFTTVLFRLATEDIDYQGATIPKGAPIIFSQAAANRDPARWPDPDRLDLTRDTRGHLGWGHGVHNCLGAALARLEGEIAVPALFRRFPHLRLAIPRTEIRFLESLSLRRIHALPVTLR